MKNIVLYSLVVTTGLMLLTSQVAGQKSSIDLLPSSHQRIQPESMVDTGAVYDSMSNVDLVDPSDELITGEKVTKTTRKRENRRKWFQLDSIFQKKEAKNNVGLSRSGSSFLILRFLFPTYSIIHITALKL